MPKCNTAKLKGLMAEKGITQAELAERMGIAKSTLNRKIKDGDTFLIGEASKVIAILNLTGEQAVSIFLPEESQ